MRVLQGALEPRQRSGLEAAYGHFRLERRGYLVSPATLENYDYLLQVEVADLPAYEDFHANQLASLPGVAMVTSYVTMKTLSADT